MERALTSAGGPWGSKVVFVLGAGGFIGSHVTSAFVCDGWKVIGLGRMPRARAEGLKLQYPSQWVSGSVTANLLEDAAGKFGHPEVIVHAAGGSSVAASFQNPEHDCDRTVASTLEVLSFMRAVSRRSRLVFLSSAAVYGEKIGTIISEDASLAPVSPYGLHKKIAEDLLRGYAQFFGLDVSIIRLFSVFGPGNQKQLLWDLGRKLSTGAPSLELSGTGDEARDFLYIDDAIRIIQSVSRLEAGAVPLVINGGTGAATTVREAALALCDALGFGTEIVFTGERRVGDPERLVADPARARYLGLRAQVSLEQGLRLYAKWFHSVFRAETRIA